MVRRPGKDYRSKQRGQDLGWKVHDRAHLLFCAHTLCMNYVIAMFLLVSCMNTRNHLLYFVRFCTQSAPKIGNKKPITKNSARLHNHFPLLTILFFTIENEAVNARLDTNFTHAMHTCLASKFSLTTMYAMILKKCHKKTS